MSFVLSHKYPSKRIFLSSKACDISVNRGDVTFVFRQAIHVPKETQVYLTLAEMTIPNSLYNINNSNNDINILMNNVSYNYTITPSNYTATTLVTQLNSIMTGFTISYNSNNSKLTISNSNYNFTIFSNSSAFGVLGFDYLNGDITSVLNTVTSTRQIDLSGYRGFYFTTQLPSENVNFMQKNQGKICNILAKIQMVSNQSGIDYYNNVTNFKSKISTNRIELLHIQLYDDNWNYYIPQHDWAAMLELEFYDDTELKMI